MGALAIEVIDDGGLTIPAVLITLDCPAVPDGARQFRADEDGHVRIEGVETGECTVVAQKQGFTTARKLNVRIEADRTTPLTVEMAVPSTDASSGEMWPALPLLEEEAGRGTLIPRPELDVLPFHALGGPTGVLRHPAVGATHLGSDRFLVDRQPWSPIGPESATFWLGAQGVDRAWSGNHMEGRTEVAGRTDGEVWRGVGVAAGRLLEDRALFFAAVEGETGEEPGAFARLTVLPASLARLRFDASKSGSSADLRGDATQFFGPDAGIDLSAGVRVDPAAPGTARAYESARAWLYEYPKHAITLEQDAMGGTAVLPLHLATSVADEWVPVWQVVVSPSLGWRERDALGGPVWRLGVVVDPDGGRQTGAFAAVERRWEGIDTDDLPLVRRDELLLGAGVTAWPDLRFKLSALGALRDGGALPADASLQLAFHHPFEDAWAVESAVTWRPPYVNVGDQPYEMGALFSWAPGWVFAPRIGIGAGAVGGDGPVQGQLAARLGARAAIRDDYVEVAAEGAIGEPTWIAEAPEPGADKVMISVRVGRR